MSEYEIDELKRAEYEDLLNNTPTTTYRDVTYVDDLVPLLKEYEGFSPKTEVPTPGDVPTIGHGSTGPAATPGNTITRGQAHNLLVQDVEERDPQLKKLIPEFETLPLEVQVPLGASFFRGSLGGSPKTVEHINKGEFLKAADEFLNNDEYRNAEQRGRPGIKRRMEATSKALRKHGTGIHPLQGGTL